MRVMDYLKENHAEEAIQLPTGKSTVSELSDETLREMVRGGIGRGKNYGIEWKSTLLSFVVLLFIVAPNFDRHPKARKFFRETEKIDDEALEDFLDEMTDEDYEAIEKRYYVPAWNLPAGEGVNV